MSIIGKVTRLIRRFAWNMKNICEWIPVLWNNYDWDYIYLLLIMRHKVKKMKEHHLKYGIALSSPRTARQLKVAEILMDRIATDDYGEKLREKHEQKYGELIFEHGESDGLLRSTIIHGALVDPNDAALMMKEGESLQRIRKYEARMKNQDIEYLCRIISRHLTSWWD